MCWPFLNNGRRHDVANKIIIATHQRCQNPLCPPSVSSFSEHTKQNMKIIINSHRSHWRFFFSLTLCLPASLPLALSVFFHNFRCTKSENRKELRKSRTISHSIVAKRFGQSNECIWCIHVCRSGRVKRCEKKQWHALENRTLHTPIKETKINTKCEKPEGCNVRLFFPLDSIVLTLFFFWKRFAPVKRLNRILFKPNATHPSVGIVPFSVHSVCRLLVAGWCRIFINESFEF